MLADTVFRAATLSGVHAANVWVTPLVNRAAQTLLSVVQ
jgi:hypothetical protein